MLNWNVRGLNAPIKRSAVKDMVQAVHATVVCLHETKL
jgi:exonuclease III